MATTTFHHGDYEIEVLSNKGVPLADDAVFQTQYHATHPSHKWAVEDLFGHLIRLVTPGSNETVWHEVRMVSPGYNTPLFVTAWPFGKHHINVGTVFLNSAGGGPLYTFRIRPSQQDPKALLVEARGIIENIAHDLERVASPTLLSGLRKFLSKSKGAVA